MPISRGLASLALASLALASQALASLALASLALASLALASHGLASHGLASHGASSSTFQPVPLEAGRREGQDLRRTVDAAQPEGFGQLRRAELPAAVGVEDLECATALLDLRAAVRGEALRIEFRGFGVTTCICRRLNLDRRRNAVRARSVGDTGSIIAGSKSSSASSSSSSASCRARPVWRLLGQCPRSCRSRWHVGERDEGMDGWRDGGREDLDVIVDNAVAIFVDLQEGSANATTSSKPRTKTATQSPEQRCQDCMPQSSQERLNQSCPHQSRRKHSRQRDCDVCMTPLQPRPASVKERRDARMGHSQL